MQKNSENKPRGLHFLEALFEGLIFGGATTEIFFLRYRFVGLIFEGAYFRKLRRYVPLNNFKLTFVAFLSLSVLSSVESS